MTQPPHEGYVYVLTNAAMPGMIKIGRTDADDPEDRARQLYSTGVPVPFDVEYAGIVENPKEVEAILHNAFRDARVNPKREFFRVAADQAIPILERLTRDATSAVRADLDTGLSESEKKSGERLRRRRPQLNFEEMDIGAGTQLRFVRDDRIVAEVVEAKKVRYEDEIISLSRATSAALGVEYGVAPGSHWLVGDELLEDVYERTYPPLDD